MPPVQRIVHLQGIVNHIKAVRSNLERCEASGRLPIFHSELSGLATANDKLEWLAQDADRASDGYVTAKKIRRALWLAARELETQQTMLEELISEAREYSTIPQIKSSEFFSRLMEIEFALKHVRFSPDVPRPKITTDELAQMDRDESSDNEPREQLMSSPDSILNTSHSTHQSIPQDDNPPSTIPGEPSAPIQPDAPESDKPGAYGDAALRELNKLFGA